MPLETLCHKTVRNKPKNTITATIIIRSKARGRLRDFYLTHSLRFILVNIDSPNWDFVLSHDLKDYMKYIPTWLPPLMRKVENLK